MNTETVIKDLERCLNADCKECGHAQAASKLTCGKLLKSVLAKVRQLAIYERMLKQGRMVKLPCAAASEKQPLMMTFDDAVDSFVEAACIPDGAELEVDDGFADKHTYAMNRLRYERDKGKSYH